MRRILRPLTLFHVRGIPVQLHTSTLFFYFVLVLLTEHAFLPALFGMLVMFLYIAPSILLHEFGHVFAAMRCGVRTRFVMLIPVGAVAKMESLGKNPKETLQIALAGPLVSFLLFASVPCLLALADVLVPTLWSESSVYRHAVSWFLEFSLLNFILFGFNLLPLFPMDGGRALCALLSMKYSEESARRFTGALARIGAIWLGIFGFLYGYWMLVLVALFVYLFSSTRTEPTYAQTSAQTPDPLPSHID